jgi:hypothetical protein
MAYVVIAAGDELRVAADGPLLQVFALPESARLFAHALEDEHGVPALVLERTPRQIAELLIHHGVAPEDVDARVDVVEAATLNDHDCALWVVQLAERVASRVPLEEA